MPVLKAGDAPVGTQYVASASGPQSIQQLVKGDQDATQEVTLLQQAGFLSADRAIFTGLQLPDSVLRGHLVASFVVVFGTAAAADQGLQVLSKTAAGTANQVKPVATTGLGPDAKGMQIALSTFPGDSFMFAWAEGNTARFLIDAGGTGVVTESDARALAVRVAGQLPSGATAADASQLVLQPADAPAGTQLSSERSGPRTVKQFAPAATDAATLTKLGFAAGYENQYLSPGLAHPAPASSASGTSARQDDYIESQAQSYKTQAAAQRAYILFRDREQKLLAGQAQPLSMAAFGADAAGYRYVDHSAAGDIIGYAFYWRRGTYLLSLFDVGTPAFASESTARSLAAIMDSRASH